MKIKYGHCGKFGIRTLSVLVVLIINAVLSGCAELPTEEQIRTEFNWYRPAVVLTYELSNDTRINNRLAIREAIDHQIPKEESRQVVVVSRIGNGGGSVAMERAKKTALLLLESGELSPRMYVRKDVATERSARSEGKVELYVFPSEVWSDKAFVRVMKTDSIEIAPLGGVLRSDVARVAMNEVFERRITTRIDLLENQILGALKDVGWDADFENYPNVEGRSAQYAVSLPEDGSAYPLEAVTLVERISRDADVFGVNIRVDHERKMLVVSNGVLMSKGNKHETN